MVVACDQRSLGYAIDSLTGKVWGGAEILITKGCTSRLTIGDFQRCLYVRIVNCNGGWYPATFLSLFKMA